MDPPLEAVLAGAAEDGLELDASLFRISAIENELPWTLADIIPVLGGFETKKFHLGHFAFN